MIPRDAVAVVVEFVEKLGAHDGRCTFRPPDEAAASGQAVGCPAHLEAFERRRKRATSAMRFLEQVHSER